jgi:hypothetical protein
MRSLETINLLEIKGGGYALTENLEYARALQSAVVRTDGRPVTVEHKTRNGKPVYMVRLVEAAPLPKPADHVVRDRQPIKVGEIRVSGGPTEDIMQPAEGGACFAVPTFPEHERRQEDDRRAGSPRRRSEDFTLIGTYELVILGAGLDPRPHSEFRRLNFTSVPNHMLRDERQIELLTDALNTVACFEYDLDPAAVFTMIHADTFEAATDRRIT